MANTRVRVLVVDDERAMREVLEMRLAGWGYAVDLAGDAEDALAIIRRRPPDVVLSDVVMPGLSGIELLERFKADDPARPVIMMTAHGSIDDAVEAMKLGADDFLTKPVEPDHLRAVLEAAIGCAEDRRSAGELARTLGDGLGPAGIVGESAPIRELLALIERVAPSEADVLVSGESGTGKERVALAIHELGPRRTGPFVAVNAAAVPETLVESHFFGHEKGAFTGADRRRAGCFEEAAGGTLFLDEITEMPLTLQPKLLRVLEQRSLRRVGGDREVPVDVRVVAASNRDPRRAVEEGKLREDLYYRLSVFPLTVPPLRDRPEDIPLLAQHFIGLANTRHGTEVDGVSEVARQRLAAHDWPGNVRELRNAIERGVILAGRGLLEEHHLPRFLSPRTGVRDGVVIPRTATVADAERILILETLERVDHNKAEAARRLGVDVKTIRNKLKRYEADGSGA